MKTQRNRMLKLKSEKKKALNKHKREIKQKYERAKIKRANLLLKREELAKETKKRKEDEEMRERKANGI